MANILIGGTDSAGDSALPVITVTDAINDYIPIYQNSSNSTNAISRNNFLGITGSPIGSSDSQNLTNKTMDNTNVLTIKDANLTIQNSAAPTKQMKFSAALITAGQTRTFTLPDYNATLATIAGAETLTNKTLTSPTINTAVIANPTLTVDSISGFSVGTVVSVANLSISNGVLNTNNSVITTNITDGNVTPAKLVSGTGSGWATSSWSPTWTNLTVGNGTVLAQYIQIGKFVFFRLQLTWGTTTSIGGTGITFTLPVNAESNDTLSGMLNPVGPAAYIRQGTAYLPGNVGVDSTTTARIWAFKVDGVYATNADLTATVPLTWASTDIFDCRGFYEVS